MQTVLVIKYVIPSYPAAFGINWGIANVVQSGEFAWCQNAGAELMMCTQWRS